MPCYSTIRLHQRRTFSFPVLWSEGVPRAAVDHRFLAQWGNIVLLQPSSYERIKKFINCLTNGTHEDNIEGTRGRVLFYRRVTTCIDEVENHLQIRHDSVYNHPQQTLV
jgi:hypothetical protein